MLEPKKRIHFYVYTDRLVECEIESRTEGSVHGFCPLQTPLLSIPIISCIASNPLVGCFFFNFFHYIIYMIYNNSNRKEHSKKNLYSSVFFPIYFK